MSGGGLLRGRTAGVSYDDEMPLRRQEGHLKGFDLDLAMSGQLGTLRLETGPLALHGHQQRRRPDQTGRSVDEVGHRGEGPADHQIDLPGQRLGASGKDLDVCECQLRARLPLEGGFLANRFNRHHLGSRKNNGKWQSRQACARAHISNRCARQIDMPTQRCDDRQRIEQVLAQHLLRVPDCGEVVNRVPLAHQRQEGKELFLLGRCQVETGLRRTLLQSLREIGESLTGDRHR